LANTEVQKIPATILSRCQRFDFRRVPQPLVQEHLSRIVQAEGIKADQAALRLIARKADGSVRDALSALDQCLALGGKELSVKGVTESLGIVSEEFLTQVLAHTFGQRLVAAAELLQQAFLAGVEMKQIALSLAETLRNALFVKLRAEGSLTELSDEEKKEYEQLVQHQSPESIQAAYRVMISGLEEILRSPLPRASLEMTLARLSGMGQLRSLGEILAHMPTETAGQKEAPATTPIPLRGTIGATEKKSPEPAPAVKTAAPARLPATNGSTAPGFPTYLQYVLQQSASLGALLEHAIPITPEGEWRNAAEIRIGFRKSHAFYQLQAQHKANFEKLDRCLGTYLGRNPRLVIETVSDEGAKSAPASIREKEKQAVQQATTEKRKRFLEHEVVRHTKEIFGAELSSFDIDKSKP
jgi:DNA polymerase-3 subunit gamma/tau